LLISTLERENPDTKPADRIEIPAATGFASLTRVVEYDIDIQQVP
jgi:hypothetical protein